MATRGRRRKFFKEAETYKRQKIKVNVPALSPPVRQFEGATLLIRESTFIVIDWLIENFTILHSTIPTLSSLRQLDGGSNLARFDFGSCYHGGRVLREPRRQMRRTWWAKSITRILGFVPPWIIRTLRNICERGYNESRETVEHVDFPPLGQGKILNLIYESIQISWINSHLDF